MAQLLARGALAVVALSLLLRCAHAEEHATGGEDDEATESLNAAVAAMLLGAISFQMGTFYLVNHTDPDIQLHTWKVLCATISIFVSVLIYQAVNDVVKELLLEGAGPLVSTAVAFLHAGVWYMALQVFLAVVSGALRLPCSKPIGSSTQTKEEKEAAKVDLELDMKSWAIVLGHITGFAHITAWAQMQELLGGSFVVVLLAFGSLVLVFRIGDQVREKWAKLDGKVDQCEKLWDEAAEETEDDVMCLTISFLVVQALRYNVVGVLPNAEGNFPSNTHVSNYHCFVMFSFGIVMAILGYWRTISGSDSKWMVRLVNIFPQPAENKTDSMQSKPARYGNWVRMGNDFIVAWSFLFTTHSFLANQGLGGNKMGCLGEVITAMILSIVSFMVIFFLDRQADQVENAIKNTPNHRKNLKDSAYQEMQKKAIRGAVLALGVLIGFGWERCFDVAVDSTAERYTKFLPPALMKMCLALLLAAIVLPSWRWYILPVVKNLGGFEEDEEEGEEDEEEEGEAHVDKPPLHGGSVRSVTGYVPPAPVPSPSAAAESAMASELAALRAQLADQERLVQRVAELEVAKWKKKAEDLAARLAELEQQQQQQQQHLKNSV